MSGILRNTLRLVGTAKYAPNNSTKYLRSMTLTTNHLNNSLSLVQPNYLNHNEFGRSQFTQAKKMSTNFGTTIWATGKKILSLFVADEKIRKADIVHLKVLLSDGKVRLMTREREKNLIFPPIFSIELNEESIQPISNKISPKEEESLSYSLGKWNISLDGDALTFKIDDTDETFILKHAVYVKAHIGPPKKLKNGRYQMASEAPISDCEMGCAKIISKQAGLTDNVHEYPPAITTAPVEHFECYGNQVSEVLKDTKSARIIDDKPNDFGKMKLKFPMTASLEGAPITIKMKDSDDDYTVYHTVDIRASKKLAENLENGSADEKNKRRSKIGKLRMQLESGDLIFEPRNSSDQCVFMRQEVDIEIDLDGEIPSILMSPHLKTYEDH